MNNENQNQTEEVQTSSPSAKSSILPVAAVIALLLIVGGYFLFNKTDKKDSTMTGAPTAAKVSGDEMKNDTSINTSGETKPKEITVTGSNYKFDMPEIRVKKGESLDITFKNVEGMHDFVIDEFNVKSTLLKAGGEETVSFVADKAGTFEYYCSVGNHRQMGMVGKLIVE